jgi:hypothetical protein
MCNFSSRSGVWAKRVSSGTFLTCRDVGQAIKMTKDKQIIVVAHNDYVILRDSMCFTVGETSTTAKKGYKRATYHRTLADAVSEVSKRMLDRKFSERAAAEQTDFASLIELIRAHDAMIKEVFKVV